MKNKYYTWNRGTLNKLYDILNNGYFYNHHINYTKIKTDNKIDTMSHMTISSNTNEIVKSKSYNNRRNHIYGCS